MPEKTNPENANIAAEARKKSNATRKLKSSAGDTRSTASSGALLRVKRVRSAIRRPQEQKDTLRALGLTRMNKLRELPDNPSVRGMVAKVSHLLKVEGSDDKNKSKKSL